MIIEGKGLEEGKNIEKGEELSTPNLHLND